MQVNLIKSLFKPQKKNEKSFTDFLDSKTKRNFYKHKIWFECVKSKNELCANTECKYNFVSVHGNALYVELKQEIESES